MIACEQESPHDNFVVRGFVFSDIAGVERRTCMSEFVVELKNVTKAFPGVVALRNMSLQIRPGEIHGLIGENGAGKSTLIKALTGVHKADAGEMFVDGKTCVFTNPNQSKAAGIACVYQELNIVKLLSVTDNIFINNQIRAKGGWLDYKSMHKKAREIMNFLGQDLDVTKAAGTFGMGVQQMIEIAKAVLIDAKLIIMDEPTSSLGEKEVAQLMQTCRDLKSRGIAILFVSHKLEELFEICDCVTVMRDGEHIDTKKIDEWSNDALITAMVGRTLDNMYPKVNSEPKGVALKVEHLTEYGVLKDVSFEARYGEILGFAGLVGAGRTETMRAIFGADTVDEGTIWVAGKKVRFHSPAQAIKSGIGFLTEDRKGQGLVLMQSVRMNLILANMKRFCKGLVLDETLVRDTAAKSVESLHIKTPSLDEVTGQLSGGNQQKVVIGKWINADSDIYIFDEPTRGIDVGAKVEVYRVMNELVLQGKCVIMISSEMPEILGMSDRVVVMREGSVMATVDRDSKHFNQESLMKAAWGGKLDE